MRALMFAALAALAVGVGVLAWSHADSAEAGTHGLVLKSGAAESESLGAEQFLTAVTEDVDAYWTRVFADAGRSEPRVRYAWIPSGQTVSTACGDNMGGDAAAYCPGDDTIYISEQFATGIYTGALDRYLPGSAQGFGGAAGDFAVAYIVAHEYGHQIQHELGLFDQQRPTVDYELQADCFAGSWARSAYDDERLEDGDLQEALDAALAVGDFDTENPGHHGTPEQRRAAWTSGFESSDPAACTL